MGSELYATYTNESYLYNYIYKNACGNVRVHLSYFCNEVLNALCFIREIALDIIKFLDNRWNCPISWILLVSVSQTKNRNLLNLIIALNDSLNMWSVLETSFSNRICKHPFLADNERWFLNFMAVCLQLHSRLRKWACSSCYENFSHGSHLQVKFHAYCFIKQMTFVLPQHWRISCTLHNTDPLLLKTMNNQLNYNDIFTK